DETRTYEEISIFLVELRELQEMEKIATVIMESIPYPIILIGKFKDQYNFFGAHQRDNLVDEQKIILEKVYKNGFLDSESKLIEQIKYISLMKNDLFTFYNDYIQSIIEVNLTSRNIQQTENKEATLQKIERLEEEITKFKSKL